MQTTFLPILTMILLVVTTIAAVRELIDLLMLNWLEAWTATTYGISAMFTLA